MARLLLIRRWLRLLVFLAAVSAVAVTAAGCGRPAEAEAEGTSTTTLSGAEVTQALQADLPIPDSVCLGCHTDFSLLTSQEDRGTFSHQLHLGRRIPCLTCHTGAGHEGVMTAPDGAVCAGCHGVPMPHPAAFLASHGRLVAELGPAVCGRCHDAKLYCEQCHGVPMPHPDSWNEAHGALATAEPDVCARCHSPKTCARCHGEGVPHPSGWVESHGKNVLAAGSSAACGTCHAPEFCTACHGTPVPHGTDWGKAHSSAANGNEGPCLVCHVQADCDACHDLHKTHGKGGGS